jgi:anhydro-N-acetylmuramic acid kinase
MSRVLYLGLMSGTSMDAIDCALVEMREGQPCGIGQHASPMPDALKQQLQTLSSGAPVSLAQLGRIDIELGALFADAALALLTHYGLQASDIRAIGSHGQTVWHQPPGSGSSAFSLQLGDPNTIAQRTGITTVADFRRRDMAAGGQGAPIVPVLHQRLFQRRGVDRIVLNLGGIANITVLPGDERAPLGFDTGPANGLMDAWIQQQQGRAYDADGRWAASAEPSPELLQLLLEEPYFTQPPPKSTGRELFNLSWLQQQLARLPQALDAACVQATLLALTVETVARAIEGQLETGEVLVCGGGAHNSTLLQRLAQRLPRFSIGSTTAQGLHVDYVEATAFAWFAHCTLQREPVAFQPFTGARQAVIAGGVYYA